MRVSCAVAVAPAEPYDGVSRSAGLACRQPVLQRRSVRSETARWRRAGQMTRFDSLGARASAEARRAIQLAERAVAARMAAQRAPARGRLGRSARKADGRAEGYGLLVS